MGFVRSLLDFLLAFWLIKSIAFSILVGKYFFLKKNHRSKRYFKSTQWPNMVLNGLNMRKKIHYWK